ncbi:MFS general substrate transporter [Eremomyces bilateralis CBS 781.70]|uniref:MFS general substrate transporter n=1 Tax=Eremomyces bilateralis CBS 781.70 TaxID=1392243 RepID=A0A6G1G2F6_9PEZI|nr:MFS general substrate transporter [Eremomyces bilateralis CBS 781.70]KAF1811989.1 MFS general substrate transporter [Eremomyces bilateralis CBS 781.70]
MELSESEKPSDKCPEALKDAESGTEVNRRSVLVLVGSFFAVFVTTGFLNAFGVFQEYLYAHLLSDRTEFDIAWIGSLATFLMFAAAPAPGVLLDRIGPAVPLSVGAILVPFAMFMLSLCTEYYQFVLAQGVLLGIGMSFLAIPTIAMVPKYFQQHRGLAMGATIGGSSCGGVIWPIMLDRMLNHHRLSFEWTIRIMAFTMLPLGVLSVLTVRSPAKPVSTTASGDGEDLQDDAQQQEPRKKIDFSIAKNGTFILLCIGLALTFLGLFTPLFFVTTYATALGHSASFAFYLVSIANGASLFGRIIPGILSDRYGHFNLLIIACVTSAVVALCWTAAKSAAGLVVWSLAYGFSSGAILILQAACSTQLSTPETYGTAIGLVLAAVSVTGLVGNPISGKLVPHGYLALSLYSGLSIMVGGALIGWSRVKQDKKLFAKV